jgi:hypothetical protein
MPGTASSSLRIGLVKVKAQAGERHPIGGKLSNKFSLARRSHAPAPAPACAAGPGHC